VRGWLGERGIALGFSRARAASLPRLRRFGIVADGDPVYASNREALRAAGD
jgi:hypothetical protein